MNLINTSYINEKDKELSHSFLHDTTIKKYVLGINKLTKSVARHVEIDGVIDDFSRVQRSRKKDIVKLEDVEKDAIILWVATGSPLEVKNKLDELGYKNLSYLAFYKYSQLELSPPPFITDFKDDFANNYSSYKYTYNLLADAKSKEIFTKVINFKISYDYEFMQGFTNNHSEQYFDKEFIPDIKNICFFDGGGYVGDTASEVIKNFPDFKKIYLVEPIGENLRIAKRDLAEYDNIEFLACGISKEKTTMHFNEEKSFSSALKDGEQTIAVDTIDNIVKQRVDYIKLDIEGAEQEAIDGAINTIKKYKPILAVCIYHKAEDWYKIPQKILAIQSDYKLYLRHYMEGIFESVLYFIPSEREKI